MELEAYLEALASNSPTPGGGSAATLVVAFAAALVAMVARIVRANPKYAAKASLAEALIAQADALRRRAAAGRQSDEAAYESVVAALGLPRGTESEQTRRSGELERALTAAAAAPLRAAQLAVEAAVLADRALALGNRQLLSDLGCAADFAGAGLSACAFNVRVNHRYMKDRAAVARDEAKLADCEREAAPLLGRVRAESVRALTLPAEASSAKGSDGPGGLVTP
ncbi:MAG: cyclodeaminase/cyclohydrolase family protein [Candidatus Eremiobacteraeota bacterium]|nr:cyclodeaminase/cyclohydrolase family protein [Candidatus Eremiobacteraeota bacterium]